MKYIKQFQNWLKLNDRQFNYFLYAIFLSLILRVIVINYYLPYYSIDENEVVESAIAFISGDLDPRFYKYGFLTSYILAVIYKLYAIILSLFSSTYLSSDQVLYEVFFNRYAFYFIARFVQAIFHITIAVFIYRLAIVFFNKRVAFYSLVLLLVPIQEFHLEYTVRVDATLALCFVLSAYFYMMYIKTEDKKYLNGIFITLALSFSSKPMPSLFSFIILLMPFIISKNRPKFVVHFAFVFILVSLVVNPYFILKFKEFVQYNYDSLMGFQTSSEEMSRFAFGYEFYWLVQYGFWFKYFSIAMLIALIPIMIIFRKESKYIFHFMLIPYAYLICFSFFNVRYYWFIVIIPFLLVSIIYIIDKFSSLYIKNDKFVHVIYAGLFILANYYVFLNPVRGLVTIANDVLTKDVAIKVAEDYIFEKIPKNARILLVGNQSRSPYIYSPDINFTAQRGQYFMYERLQNKGYVRFFQKAFQDYVKKNKTFQLVSTFGNSNYNNINNEQLRNILENQMVNYLKSQKIKYVVLVSNKKEHVENWESDPAVELLINTSTMSNTYGNPVKIFEVK